MANVNTYVAILGWALVIASTVTPLPQLLHLIKGQRIGVEPLTASIASTTMACWIIFTASIQDLPAFASSVGPLIIWLSVLAILSFHNAPKSRLALVVTILAIMVATLARLTNSLSVESFGFLAALGSTTWALPQLVRAFRHRKRDLSGVSFWAYLFLGLENAGWIIYSAGTGVIAYALAPMVQLPACLAIALISRSSKKHSHLSQL